jgi:hypothetical protein
MVEVHWLALKTCTRAAGAVQPYGKIEIRLSQDTVVTATSANYLAAPIEVVAAADGSVSVQLQANNDLTPNNTFYTVTEFAGPTDSTYFVQVPQTAGPFDLTAIQVSVPPAPAPVGAAHVASLLVDGATTISGTLAQTGIATFAATPVFSLGATFSAGAGVVAFASGDDVQYFVNGTAFEMDARQGTSGAPITVGSGPTFKISRTERITEASMPAANGANNQGNAGLWVSATGDAANEAQVCGVLGTAINKSTQTAHNDDAVGVQGLGSVQGSGTGYAAGGYFHGRRDTNTGNAYATEMRCSNFTGTDGVYSSAGPSDTMGVWVTANGNNPGYPAVAVAVGRISPSSWHVGFGVTASSVTDQAFRDDSSAATSLLINGSHATAAVAISGSDPVLIGGIARLVSPSRLEVQGATGSSSDPLVLIGNTAGSFTHTIQIRNSVGTHKIGVCGANGSILSGTTAGDLVIQAATGGKTVHLAGSALAVSVKDATLGFYGVAPIAQRAGAAQAAVATTGSTQTTPFGYTTAAQADAIVTLVNELRAWAVVQGFIKGAA